MWIQKSAGLLAAAFLIAYQTNPPVEIRAQATLANSSLVPFVTGIIPVVGGNGEVGGVAVDAKGVVSRVEAAGRDLAEARHALLNGPVTTRLRMVSLANLEKEFVEHFERGEAIPEQMLFLGGLQRIEYVFAVADTHDIILAGPAEEWRVQSDGTAVGVRTGRPLLRLDDLLEAFRTAKVAVEGPGISCSIDPTEEGCARLERLLRDRNMRVSSSSAARMKRALGPQRITITGVLPDSHFARVMVSADYLMKRLAMGLEASPVEGMPSYLELLQAQGERLTQTASPRFWMAVNYEPLLQSADGLSWQLRGPGVKVLTEHAFMDATGERVSTGETDEAAAQWASTMTEKYDQLSAAMPVFGELRNGMDMAVVAALITHHDLLGQVDLELPHIAGGTRARGPAYDVPTTVESHVSAIRAGNAWIVGISGGVDLDSWSVLQSTAKGKLAVASRPAPNNRWWWD